MGAGYPVLLEEDSAYRYHFIWLQIDFSGCDGYRVAGYADRCDYCGGDLYQRKDDTKETIEERLVVYNNKTKPIITYYESLGILVPVNSNQEPSKVIDEIINKVN